MVTSISNLCRDFKWLLVMLGCTRDLKGIYIWPLAYNEGKHQLKSLNFVDDSPTFTIESSHPNNFFFGNYCSDCIVIAKTFLDLAEDTVAIIFRAGCSYRLCKAKTNNSLWNVETIQYKPLSKHTTWQHCWSTRVVYTGYGDVDSNS